MEILYRTRDTQWLTVRTAVSANPCCFQPTSTGTRFVRTCQRKDLFFLPINETLSSRVNVIMPPAPCSVCPAHVGVYSEETACQTRDLPYLKSPLKRWQP